MITARARDDHRRKGETEPADGTQITDRQDVIGMPEERTAFRNTGTGCFRKGSRVALSFCKNGMQCIPQLNRGIFQEGGCPLQQREISGLRAKSQVGSTQGGQHGNSTEGVVFRIADRPEYRQGENGVSTAVNGATCTCKRGKQCRFSALLERSGQRDKHRRWGDRFHRFVQVMQMTVMERIVFRNNTEN